LEKGNFVGEVAFLTEKPATATVIAEGAVRALVFETGKLNQVFRNEAEVAGLIYQLLGRELAHKMKVSNKLLSTAKSQNRSRKRLSWTSASDVSGPRIR
jgi:CRP-like cAMP-binding protein